MANVTVKVSNPQPIAVILKLTPEEAQGLHDLLGNIAGDDLAKLVKHVDPKLLAGEKPGNVFDVLDDELHEHQPYFKGTIGR